MYSNIHINSAVRFLPFNSLCFVDAKQTYNPGDTWNFNKTIWSLCHLVHPSRANNGRNCWNDSADRLHCIESVYATLAALKYYLQLPSKKGVLPRYRELWRFGWPVILMQTAESGIAFTISFF